MCMGRKSLRRTKRGEMGGQRRTEICGFVGSAWHSLPLLKPCDRLASLVWCQFPGLGGIDTTPWMNALSGHLTSLARLWLFSVVRARFTWRDQIFFLSLFVPPLPLVPCPALTRQSTWGDYMGYISVAVPGWSAVFLNAAHVEIHFMS